MTEQEDEVVVDLGYLEESEHWKLDSRYFPSKVGGKPAWLDLCSLPDKILCTKCSKPCIFLCQVYAPFEENDSCFHRTVFVFFCKDPECCGPNDSGNFRVFRCQLKRINDFYSFHPPVECENWQPEVTPARCKLCYVCGGKGASQCGKCKAVEYCSKEHQIIDWKSGHKEICNGNTIKSDKKDTKHAVLLPEYEIVIDPEEPSTEDDAEKEEKSEEEKLLEFQKMVQEGKAGTLQGESSIDEDLEKMAASVEDKQFLKFTAKIKENPDQVLRYEKGGEPLWISSNHVPSDKDIPCCPLCGECRQFEFQILPQMLNYLKLDNPGRSVDWGVLAVYTCKESCSKGPVYKEEFLWKQDVSSN